MSEFRFILNGTTLNDHPDGWQDFTEAIVRDNEVHGITLEYEANLTFVGDGYEILEDSYQNSYCAEANLTIEQLCGSGQFEPICDLLIKISDIDTNMNRCEASAKATDNTYYGMIHNNRETSIRLDGSISKNGIGIAPCPLTEFKVFLPTLSSGDVDYLGAVRVGYDHKEALSYSLRYMTDNRITEVVSDYLDGLTFSPNPEYFNVDNGDDVDVVQTMGMFLVGGYGLRVGGTSDAAKDVRITFKKLIDTLHTKHGLMWAIEDGKFRIEPIEYFFEQTILDDSMVLDAQTEIVRSIETTRLYSAVDFGSSEDLPDRELIYAMPYVDLISHQRQRYNLEGVCNTDTVLDLITGYPYDSNVIEKIIVTEQDASNPTEKDQSYDDDVFYIQYFRHDAGGNADDLYYSAFSSLFLRPDAPNEDTGIVYNPYLFNLEVSKRHRVQSDYSFYTADDDDNFKASKSQTPLLFNSVTQQMSGVDYLEVGNSSFLSDLQSGFGLELIPDMSQGSWGGLMNNSENNNNYPDGGGFPARRIPFNNDSTGGNFDPNDNWDVDEYYFTAPATGVYGFDISAIINKQSDQIYTLNNEWVPTSLVQSGFRVVRPRTFFTYLYAVYYDSSDNYLSHELISAANGFDQQMEFSVINGNGGNILSFYNGFNQSYLNNNLQVSQPLTNMVFDVTGGVGDSYSDPQTLTVPLLTHIDAGNKMAIMCYTSSSYHLPHPAIGTRRFVRYGVEAGSSIETTFFLTGGGNFEAVDVDSNFATIYEFDRPTNIEQWIEMKSNPKKSVFISKSLDSLIRTYPNRVVRNLAKGETNFSMIGNRKQTHY